MKLFSFKSRPQQNEHQIPHVRVGVAHLIGYGKLRCEQSHLIMECDDRRQVRVDVEGLVEVLLYGKVSITADAIEVLNQQRIALTLLDISGTRILGRLAQDQSDRTLMRLLQLQSASDSQWSLALARDIVREKLETTLAALRHYQRQGKKPSPGVLEKLDRSQQACQSATSVESLRGIEGQAAAVWYSQYGNMFRKQWTFSKRTRRPPRDPVNALLSLGYMQVYRRCVARLEASGYEASLGALHEFRSGRMSLACDIMEPLRIPAVDRWVLAICQQGMVQPTDFETRGDGGVMLRKEKLRDVLVRFEEHWHQSMFRFHLDNYVGKLRDSLRDRVSSETSRMSAELKLAVVRASRGSGGEEVYEP